MSDGRVREIRQSAEERTNTAHASFPSQPGNVLFSDADVGGQQSGHQCYTVQNAQNYTTSGLSGFAFQGRTEIMISKLSTLSHLGQSELWKQISVT